MKVRKFCICGVKLERDVAGEDAAREIVEQFRLAHIGSGHGPASYQKYRGVISQIVARNTKSKRPREAKPLLAEMQRAEAACPHRWVNSFGFAYCSVCLAVKGNHTAECAGAALMIRSEFIGYPLPWLRELEPVMNYETKAR
jgi:hypothetical protein